MKTQRFTGVDVFANVCLLVFKHLVKPYLCSCQSIISKIGV